ncbi:hypothetical protein GC102_12920 [Paenibacillus sp. LMG 31460]|uniref:Uncharacterized protein n=1 Tax=Paenibacillus germinis TaxID=2654979 RepID=A0ABX1YZU8_9BACL|nr:hypothetical protein [Paenibacillus germinis]
MTLRLEAPSTSIASLILSIISSLETLVIPFFPSLALVLFINSLFTISSSTISISISFFGISFFTTTFFTVSFFTIPFFDITFFGITFSPPISPILYLMLMREMTIGYITTRMIYNPTSQ